MTEEQKKKYEEAAEEYSPFGSQNPVGSGQRELFETRKRHFLAGAEHTHSEGFNQGWNEALGDVEKGVDELNEMFSIRGQISYDAVIEILQKLRK